MTAEAAAKKALFQRLLSLLSALRAESEAADAEIMALHAAAAALPSLRRRPLRPRGCQR